MSARWTCSAMAAGLTFAPSLLLRADGVTQSVPDTAVPRRSGVHCVVPGLARALHRMTPLAGLVSEKVGIN